MDLPQLSKLSEALSKAQGEIQPPTKNRKVDFTDKNGRRVNYSYADLADLIEAIKGPLSKNGLSVTHQLEMGGFDNRFGMKTTLLHSSGESISTWYPIPDPSQLRPQEFGSALTYARRYSLSCLVGVASEEDDDGAEAQAPQAPQKPAISRPQSSGGPSEAQVKRLFAIANANQWSNDRVKHFMQTEWGIDSTSKLNREQYDHICKLMEAQPQPQSQEAPK